MSWLLVHTKIFENFEDVRPMDAFRSSRVPKFLVFDRMSHQVTAADSGGRPGKVLILATQCHSWNRHFYHSPIISAHICKGYCGRARRRAGCGAERGTSRGSEEKRVRIHLQAQSNIQSDMYQVQNIKGNKEKPKRGKRA